jgi:N-succinyldiaminopimelate aminotransferase
MSDRLPCLTSRLQGFGTTIFAEMSALAAAHDAVNLSQGFPDVDPPEAITEAAVAAIRGGRNQYAPGIGVAALRQAIAAHRQRFHGQAYDPDDEVTVTAGATEAVCAALQAVCEVGDDVVVFEPAYDAYLAGARMAGAVPRPVTLPPPDFRVDAAELAQVVGPRTRAIVVNSPHNPTGAVFGEDDLEAIAAVCRERDVLAITDEVYEHLVYSGPHRSLASRAGMRERTVVISSAAKTFSATGWKIGWVCAPPALTTAVRIAKQFMTFTNGTPFQDAIAVGLGLDDGFFVELAESHRARRDQLAAGLSACGFDVMATHGSYFVLTDVASAGYDDDVAFCRDLPAKVGVGAVPCSGFYTDPRRGRGLVRFAFCKRGEVIAEAVKRLQAAFA